MTIKTLRPNIFSHHEHLGDDMNKGMTNRSGVDEYHLCDADRHDQRNHDNTPESKDSMNISFLDFLSTWEKSEYEKIEDSKLMFAKCLNNPS